MDVGVCVQLSWRHRVMWRRRRPTAGVARGVACDSVLLIRHALAQPAAVPMPLAAELPCHRRQLDRDQRAADHRVRPAEINAKEIIPTHRIRPAQNAFPPQLFTYVFPEPVLANIRVFFKSKNGPMKRTFSHAPIDWVTPCGNTVFF